MSPAQGEPEAPPQLFGEPEASALDVIDHLLDKGCVVTGRLVLGLAGIDLVHVELSLLLCGAERLLARTPHHRRPESPQASSSERFAAEPSSTSCMRTRLRGLGHNSSTGEHLGQFWLAAGEESGLGTRDGGGEG